MLGTERPRGRPIHISVHQAAFTQGPSDYPAVTRTSTFPTFLSARSLLGQLYSFPLPTLSFHVTLNLNCYRVKKTLK